MDSPKLVEANPISVVSDTYIVVAKSFVAVKYKILILNLTVTFGFASSLILE